MKLLKKCFVAICSLCALLLMTSAKIDEAPTKSIQKEGERLARKFDLKLISNGTGCLSGSTKATWALSFTSAKAMTIEQARPMVAEMVSGLLYMMYHEKGFADYVEYMNKRYSKTPTTLNNEKVGFRLAFWDKDVNRPLQPYLAQVRMSEGKIFYHYADPKTQALQEPIVETFEAAGVKMKG